MSELHAAVTRAIAEHDGLCGQLTWDELRADWQAMYERMAATAIRVVLAEAQRAVEAERWAKPDTPNSRIHDDQSGWRAWRSHEKAIDASLAVLAALGDEA